MFLYTKFSKNPGRKKNSMQCCKYLKFNFDVSFWVHTLRFFWQVLKKIAFTWYAQLLLYIITKVRSKIRMHWLRLLKLHWMRTSFFTLFWFWKRPKAKSSHHVHSFIFPLFPHQGRRRITTTGPTEFRQNWLYTNAKLRKISRSLCGCVKLSEFEQLHALLGSNVNLNSCVKLIKQSCAKL